MIVSLTLSSPVYRCPTPYACSVPFQVWEGAVVSKRLQTRIPNKRNRRTQRRSSQNEGIMFTSCTAVIPLSSCKCKKRDKCHSNINKTSSFLWLQKHRQEWEARLLFLMNVFRLQRKKMSSQILVTVLEFSAEMEVNVTANDTAN